MTSTSRSAAVRKGRADADEAGLPQHPQVLGHGRLRDAEVALHDGGQLAGGVLAVGQQLEDPAPHRVSEDVERVHPANLPAHAYIS